MAARRPSSKPAPPQRDHAAVAAQWAQNVLDGKVLVGRYLRLAVHRHQCDLANPGPYRFDPEAGAKVCRWVELFSHIKGPLAGQPIRLEPWQCWLLVVGFGWRVAATGTRRFRKFSWWFCRGQGKSLLASLIGLYVLAEGQGAEVACAATAREQARVVFDVARHVLLARPDLARRLGFAVEKHAITVDATASVMKPVSSEAGTQEGGNASLVILDELHAHRTRELYDTLLTGCGKRPDSLFFVISTAPTDTSSIGHEEWRAARDILIGTLTDPTVFAVIIAADEGADPWSEATWRQANPGLTISVDLDYFRATAERARQVPGLRAAFFSRHLGWVSKTSTPYISSEAWAACADSTLTRSQFEGKACYVGLDLASTTDLACVAYVFLREVDGVTHYYGLTDSFIGEAAVREQRNAAYPGWAEQGHLNVTLGDATDFDTIEASIADSASHYDIRELAFDPWQSQSMVQHLMAQGLTCVELRPIYKNISEPTKTLEALVLTGRFHHDGNPVLDWAIGNVVLRRDGKDNVRPDKNRPQDKIDPAVALLTALARALLHEPEPARYGEGSFQIY